MTRKQWKASPQVYHDFEMLCFQPPHLLLAALHRRLALELNSFAGGHYEGITQAGRDLRSELGNVLAAKLKVIDEAAHLVRHLSPESSTILCSEVHAALCQHEGAKPVGDSTLGDASTLDVSAGSNDGDSCKEVQADSGQFWCAEDEDQSRNVDLNALMPATATRLGTMQCTNHGTNRRRNGTNDACNNPGPTCCETLGRRRGGHHCCVGVWG